MQYLPIFLNTYISPNINLFYGIPQIFLQNKCRKGEKVSGFHLGILHQGVVTSCIYSYVYIVQAGYGRK